MSDSTFYESEEFTLIVKEMRVFYREPLNQKYLFTSKKFNYEHWCSIFVFFFKRSPSAKISTSIDNKNSEYSDPLWDKLFNEMKTLKAQSIIHEELKVTTLKRN